MEFSGSVVSPVEADILVRQLQFLNVDQVGSEAWKTQREAVERLNMCTHSSAVAKTDDYVKSFLVEHERLPEVLHSLLVMEVWRQRILPSVKKNIATNATATYMYVNYEAVLVNFLECICFYEEVVVAFGDDILELLDYCWRQVYHLFAEPNLHALVTKPTAQDLQNRSPLAQLEEQITQSAITRAMGCLSILWFIIDRLDELPLSVANAVLQKHDLPVGLSEVLLLQPWCRGTAGAQQKFRNGTFVDVTGDEVLRVCTPEAHTWFCLHKLLCDAECRRKYPYTQNKKDRILRIRRFLNETLVDQIPALESVQRALEELSFLEPPSGTEEKFRSTLIIEQVPRLMSGIDSPQVGWAVLIERTNRMLADPQEKMKDAMRIASIFDQMFSSQA